MKTQIRISAISAAARLCGRFYVPAAVSNRHIHLSEKDVQTLFGRGYVLAQSKPLLQHGQYACHETLILIGKKGSIEKIRVLGPLRAQTQVELSLTDCFKTGVEPVIRMSGELAGTPGARLIGPAGEVELAGGVIVAARHIHASTSQAHMLGICDRDVVCLERHGQRAMRMDNVAVRVQDDFELELHIDTDEANAGMIVNGDLLEIVR
ncbi:MAG: phosphate propanoyltransferase [Christensenella sp.]|uniref:phosphate propanoyltransferase n=1 Tax=Christensenella sp. TaxID=1935934 RepID=UPI002B2129A7|nr:phosphate propanoyltransferase [Christensenella sp.]MEA5001906.1 phosphate propanoyltransferase [Christensenella sp.]